MPRNPHTLKVSDDLWQAFKKMREEGGEFSQYPSDNAALENLLFYSLYFRRQHVLILSKLTLHEQDLVHAYTKWCVMNDVDDRAKLPKPATAKDVLKLAKAWAVREGLIPAPK